MNSQLIKNLLLITVCWQLSAPALAAVQMGAHMDFVLSNGRNVRVYPEAMNAASIQPRAIVPRRIKASTKPPGGDPCIKLEQEYKKRTGEITKRHGRAKPVNQKPKWLKTTGRLKRAVFLRAHYVSNKPNGWYYLPNEPRVAYKGGIPEATFVKFMTDESGTPNSTEGGIFHLMVTFGLTKDEEQELEEALSEAVPGAVLKGMVDLEPSKTADNFVVTSGTLSDTGFAPNGVLTSGYAPSVAGTNAALAGRLSSLGAQLMEATFENPTSDLSVTFAYDYIVKTLAYRAEVRIDLDRIQEITNCALKTYDKTKTTSTSFDGKGFFTGLLTGGPAAGLFFGLKKKTKTRISERDLREAYDVLLNFGAIQIKIDQNLPEADVAAIESSLMQMAMESFTSMQKSFATNQEMEARKSAAADESETKTAEARERDRRRADNFEVFTVNRKQSRMTGVQTMVIEKGVALYRTHSMTGNLGAILREHKEEVFDEVLLIDPFFKRGEIVVDLDTEALDLFEEKMANNASISVKVPFKTRNFTDDDLFTRADIAAGNIVKRFTFATGGEEISESFCPFKYIESWSLKGGGKWPRNPKEICSKELRVTLSPPIEARRIDVEADLDEMESLNIRAADVLLRHTRYGIKKTETVKFRLAKGEPYIEHTIYVDKATPNVEYKIALTHKDKGKFQSDWQPLEDDFVFANLSGLPLNTLEKIREKVPEVQEILDDLKSILE